MARFTIGVHIGNTTTNAVILHGKVLIAKAKRPTIKNSGLKGLGPIIEKVIDNFSFSSSNDAVNKPVTRADVINCTRRISVGVPHFKNALLGRKGLGRVGVVRLCGSATQALLPFIDHPEFLQRKINGGYRFVQGGFECTKKEISCISEEGITEKVEELRNESGVQNFVVCGVYSPLDHSQEQKAANVIRNIYPNASITESHLVS